MATPATSRLIEVAIHDLRNTLNVMGLTVRLIEAEAASGGPPPAEDLSMIRENIAEFDRMLRALNEYLHVGALSEFDRPMPFDLRRMLEEEAAQVEERRREARIEIEPGEGPIELTLDPEKARLAVRMVLANAAAAAATAGAPVRVTVGRDPDRCRIGVIVAVPPREPGRPTQLKYDQFRRLLGNHNERRGLDLAIAARISEMFGGSARLDVEEGRSTTVVLDWPTQLRPVGS